tara:strand:+ start:240 stop:518 length:279 start_codon:yes stop_codon:yes gene_type:complete
VNPATESCDTESCNSVASFSVALTLVLWWSTVVTKMVDHIFENLITISDFGYGFLRFFEVGRQQQKISLRPSLECHHDFSGINPNLFQTEKT